MKCLKISNYSTLAATLGHSTAYSFAGEPRFAGLPPRLGHFGLTVGRLAVKSTRLCNEFVREIWNPVRLKIYRESHGM